MSERKVVLAKTASSWSAMVREVSSHLNISEIGWHLLKENLSDANKKKLRRVITRGRNTIRKVYGSALYLKTEADMFLNNSDFVNTLESILEATSVIPQLTTVSTTGLVTLKVLKSKITDGSWDKYIKGVEEKGTYIDNLLTDLTETNDIEEIEEKKEKKEEKRLIENDDEGDDDDDDDFSGDEFKINPFMALDLPDVPDTKPGQSLVKRDGEIEISDIDPAEIDPYNLSRELDTVYNLMDKDTLSKEDSKTLNLMYKQLTPTDRYVLSQRGNIDHAIDHGMANIVFDDRKSNNGFKTVTPEERSDKSYAGLSDFKESKYTETRLGSQYAPTIKRGDRQDRIDKLKQGILEQEEAKEMAFKERKVVIPDRLLQKFNYTTPTVQDLQRSREPTEDKIANVFQNEMKQNNAYDIDYSNPMQRLYDLEQKMMYFNTGDMFY